MCKPLTLGSLFDGSGGFPLAGIMCGITPVWASEIDPFCISVTSKRFPKMAHLGSITEISGTEIPPVDVITFGSPCQDLSVAGQRAGLEGERSGLFKEAVRIIKEMRGATSGKYPKYIVWENVLGAFSSSKGEDFRRVLEEIIKIKDGNVSVPRPPKGKWQAAGCIMGDGYSLAWRVLDAQFWGVPQRRKRIFLVGSFGNKSAAEILFKREGLCGDFKESRKAWERLAPDTENDTDLSGGEFTPKTLKSGSSVLCAGFYPQMKAESLCFTEDISNTLVNGTSAGFQNAVLVPEIVLNDQGGNSISVDKNISPTLRAEAHGNEPCVIEKDVLCVDQGGGKSQCSVSKNCSPTITCTHGGEPCVVYDGRGNGQTVPTISTYIVRRITPLECCRLQGFPDWWCSDIPHKDTPEYRMWGNGVALPCVLYVLEGISELDGKVHRYGQGNRRGKAGRN